MATMALLVLALGAQPPPADAQQAAAPAPGWITATYGAGGGSPHGAYLSAGIALGEIRYSGSLVGIRSGRGVLFQADVGQRAGALSVGTPLPFLLKTPRSWEPFGAPLVGIVPKATLLRTWDADEPRRTYLGVTAELIVILHLRLGVLWRVGGPAGEDTLVTWGIGLGL